MTFSSLFTRSSHAMAQCDLVWRERVVHVSEKKIFFKSFQNYKNNIEEDWKIISSIIGKNSSELNVHEQLEIDGVNKKKA